MGIYRFFAYFTLYSGLLAALALGLKELVAPLIVLSPNFWLLYIYLYFLTGIVYLLSVFGMRKGGEYSVFALLGGIVIKLLFALSLFLVVLIKSSENQMVLGLNFFLVYLLFTAFEVTFLLRKLRHQNKK